MGRSTAQRVHLLAVAVLAVGMVPAALAPSASAASGSFTSISTPSGTTIFHFDGSPGATNHLTVSGSTSLDITSVDIHCILISTTGPSSQLLASSVPVVSGDFAVIANLTSLSGNCRLRALPGGTVIDQYIYLGAFSGPILYMNGLIPNFDSAPTPHEYGYTAIGEQADGLGGLIDAGDCGVNLLATITVPAMAIQGLGAATCTFALPLANLNATGSAIRVDSHNAYLPYAVSTLITGPAALPLTQTELTTAFSAAPNGDITVTESAPLVRCSVDDTYPPSHSSCPALLSTGVTFSRTTKLFRAAHQFRIRDTFTSTDASAHPLALAYQNSGQPATYGAAGYVFPGHGSALAQSSLNQTITGLGTGAASMLIRSDIYAATDDPQADSTDLTWSRGPSKIVFSASSVSEFAMYYALTVPASGKAFLGFADSQAPTTAVVSPLGASAVSEMMNKISITSPTNGATVHGTSTSVKGLLTAGANGLPTSVSVNGHPATITTTSATAGSYIATFNESLGTHTITVTERDAAANIGSRSITLHNVSP